MSEMRRLDDDEITAHLYPSGRFAVGAHASPSGVIRYTMIDSSELPKPHTAVEDLKGALIKLVDMRSVVEGVPDHSSDGSAAT